MLTQLLKALSKISTSKNGKKVNITTDGYGRARELVNLDKIEIDDSPVNPYGTHLTTFEHRGRKVKIIVSMHAKGDVVTLFHETKGTVYSQFFPVEEANGT